MEGADAVITTAAGYTRPGAFLDQVARGGGDPFARRRLTWLGSDQVPMTFVLTSDLAE
jgi:hypothetical protein